MFLKTDAIVTGRRPVMNTSLLLWLYTRRYGQMGALAKGAFRKRRKAEPPSVPDLFQRGEAVLWLKSGHETAILHEWSLEDFRAGVRGNFESFRAAAGCAALIAALTYSSDDRGEHFRALEGALSQLEREGGPRPVLWAFALRELARAGFLAPAASCAICGRDFGRAKRAERSDAESCGEAAGLAPGAGGFVCRDCRAKAASSGRLWDPAFRAASQNEEGAGGDVFVPLPPEAAAAARFLSSSPACERLRGSTELAEVPAAGSAARLSSRRGGQAPEFTRRGGSDFREPPGTGRPRAAAADRSYEAASKLKVSPRAASALERAVRALAEYHLERVMPALSPEGALKTAEG